MTTARPVLEELINSLPAHDARNDRDPHASDSYTTALHEALADGYLSPDEIRSIGELAGRVGLTGDEVRDIHQELIMGLIDKALVDRRVSKAERSEIEKAASWLGVDLSDWDAMVKASHARVKAEVDRTRAMVAGKSIAFSGAGIHKTNIREALAQKHEIVYSTTVKPETAVLVVGTGQVRNQQVETARERRIPIVIEATFWQRLGE